MQTVCYYLIVSLTHGLHSDACCRVRICALYWALACLLAGSRELLALTLVILVCKHLLVCVLALDP